MLGFAYAFDIANVDWNNDTRSLDLPLHIPFIRQDIRIFKGDHLVACIRTVSI